MKIHYHSHKSDRSVSPDFVNFGDDLNEALWDQLFPSLLDTDATVIFSGVGSHLNSVFVDRFAGNRQVVFGTGYGYGYGDPIGSVDDLVDGAGCVFSDHRCRDVESVGLSV